MSARSRPTTNERPQGELRFADRTAENHVKRFIQSAGNDELASFGVTDEKSGVAAVKRGANSTLMWTEIRISRVELSA